jgi:hypothetical protein
MAIALNKVDQFKDDEDEGRGVIDKCACEALARGEIAVPCSALAENILLGQSLSELGGGSAPSVSDLQLAASVVSRWGSTGVLDAISAAVSLAPPLLVYPVGDLDTETAVASASSEATSSLPDCVLLYPGSTVMDAFAAIQHGALTHVRLSSEFVRAEGRGLAPDSRRRVLGRDAELGPDAAVVKI